jgi:hypothetical protein
MIPIQFSDSQTDTYPKQANILMKNLNHTPKIVAGEIEERNSTMSKSIPNLRKENVCIYAGSRLSTLAGKNLSRNDVCLSPSATSATFAGG